MIFVLMDGMLWNLIGGIFVEILNFDNVVKNGVKVKYLRIVVLSKMWFIY